MKYVHTNIISNDWRKLADFYITVFQCKPVLPQRKQSGKWLSQGTGVPNASLEGIHLRLPGCGEDGPTLEIYSYAEMLDRNTDLPNRKGFGHISFEVENVTEIWNKAIANGGVAFGKITEHFIEGVGQLSFVYIKDPEGNLIEVQHWKR